MPKTSEKTRTADEIAEMVFGGKTLPPTSRTSSPWSGRCGAVIKTLLGGSLAGTRIGIDLVANDFRNRRSAEAIFDVYAFTLRGAAGTEDRPSGLLASHLAGKSGNRNLLTAGFNQHIVECRATIREVPVQTHIRRSRIKARRTLNPNNPDFTVRPGVARFRGELTPNPKTLSQFPAISDPPARHFEPSEVRAAIVVDLLACVVVV